MVFLNSLCSGNSQNIRKKLSSKLNLLLEVKSKVAGKIKPLNYIVDKHDLVFICDEEIIKEPYWAPLNLQFNPLLILKCQ